MTITSKSTRAPFSGEFAYMPDVAVPELAEEKAAKPRKSGHLVRLRAGIDHPHRTEHPDEILYAQRKHPRADHRAADITSFMQARIKCCGFLRSISAIANLLAARQIVGFPLVLESQLVDKQLQMLLPAWAK